MNNNNNFTLRDRLYIITIENLCKKFSLNIKENDSIDYVVNYISSRCTSNANQKYYYKKKFKKLINLKYV